MKRTPLFESHQELGAKMIEFGGWEMPVYYTSIVEEHLAVRGAAGIFDISHMGELMVEGAKAEAFLNELLTNDIRKLSPGQGQYTLMCNERGGVIDDLYVYRMAERQYLLIVNASRVETDVTWIEGHVSHWQESGEVSMRNVSDETGAVAVQGPRVAEYIDRCLAGASTTGTSVGKASELKKNHLARMELAGNDVWVSRTGYTGEDGFEIVAPGPKISEVWRRLLEEGSSHGLKPCGLGARDTLRTEVCYPLYGQDLNQNITPLEAGLGFFVSMDKGDFVGRATLANQKAAGVTRKLVAFKMTEKSAPPRPHYPIWMSEQRVGEVTSGTQSPSLGVGIGLGYVPAQSAKANTPLEIEIRGRRFSAEVVPKPIYRKEAVHNTSSKKA